MRAPKTEGAAGGADAAADRATDGDAESRSRTVEETTKYDLFASGPSFS
jgi:hypothetical protein